MRLSAREGASHAPKGNILTQRAQSSAWIVKVALPQLQEVVAVMKGALLVPLQLALAVFLVQPAAAANRGTQTVLCVVQAPSLRVWALLVVCFALEAVPQV